MLKVHKLKLNLIELTHFSFPTYNFFYLEKLIKSFINVRVFKRVQQLQQLKLKLLLKLTANFMLRGLGIENFVQLGFKCNARGQ